MDVVVYKPAKRLAGVDRLLRAWGTRIILGLSRWLWESSSTSYRFVSNILRRSTSACFYTAMSTTRATIFLIVAGFLSVDCTLKLPNTSGIDGQLTANLGVDHFFSLWLVFNNEEVQMSGIY